MLADSYDFGGTYNVDMGAYTNIKPNNPRGDRICFLTPEHEPIQP